MQDYLTKFVFSELKELNKKIEHKDEKLIRKFTSLKLRGQPVDPDEMKKTNRAIRSAFPEKVVHYKGTTFKCPVPTTDDFDAIGHFYALQGWDSDDSEDHFPLDAKVCEKKKKSGSSSSSSSSGAKK